MDIFREQKDTERNVNKGGFKDLRKWRGEDALEQIRGEIAKKHQEFVHKRREPYDSKYALTEAEKKISQLKIDVQNAISSGEREINMNIGLDLNKFGGLDNFELLGESEVTETKLIDNMKKEVKTGVYREFVHKDHYKNGNTHAPKISVFYSMEEVNNGPKKDDKSKKN